MAAASIVIDLIARTGSFQTDTARAERSLKSLQKQLGDTRRVSEGFGDSFGNIGRELKSLAAIGAGGFGVGSIIQLADGYTKFTAQLKLATDSATDFNQAYQSVINIANQSQSDVEAIGIFYGRLARFTKDAGIEASALSDITTTVANSLRANGATAKETASTFLQLSQAFGAGRLNGQEFAAVSEAASPLLNQLAKTLTEVGDGTVVTVGQLKDLAAEGKLSLDILVKAFSDKAFVNAVKEQSKEVQTVSSAVTVLKNNFQVFVGEQDKATGSTKALASTILTLGENLETVAKVAFAAISVSIVRYIASQAQLIAQARNTIAIEQAEIKNKIRIAELNVIAAKSNIALAQGIQVQNVSLANNASLTTLAASKKFGLIKAEQELANAQKLATAQVGLLGRGLSLLGGPVGVAVTGIILFGDKLLELGKRILGITPALSELNDEIERQNKLQSSGVKDDINAQNNLQIKALRSKIAEYKELRGLIESSLTAGRIDTSNVEEFSRLFAVLGVGGLRNAQTALKALDAKILEINKKIVELTSKNVTPATSETPKVDEKFLKNLQEQIVELSRINPLLKQGVELDDASFIAKAKLAGVNDELIVTYLNLKNEQGQIVKQFEEERKILEDLNKIRKEEIPLLELISKIAAQGVDLADAEIIAKLKLKGVNDELIVTYLNAVNVQKQLVESQKQIKDATDEAKKLNEQALTPLEKLTAQYDKLVKLQQNGLTEQGLNQGLKDAVTEFESASAGALQYSNVLDELNGLYQEATKAGFDVKNVSLELTIAYNQLFEELKNGTLAKDEYIRKSQELLKTASDEAKRISELSQILSQTDTAQLDEQRRLIALLYDEYAKGANEALDSVEELGEAVRVVLGQQNVEVENSADFLEAAFKRAAENAQDAFADFLFDPFKDGLDGMLLNFVNVLKRMAAEALAAKIFENIFKSTGVSNGGDLLSKLFSGIGSFFGGGRASGGDVLAGRTYLVGERGPEMFTPRSTGTITPNAQIMNTTANVSVKNINVLDPTLVGQYLNTDAGEKVVMNVIQRNRSALGF